MSDAEIDAGMQAVNDEAAGVYSVDVFGPENIPPLVAAFVLGDKRAGTILNRLQGALDQFEKPETHKICGGCGVVLVGLPRSVALIGADRPDARHAMAFGICHDCGRTADSARQAAVRTFRMLAPEARVIDITDAEGGRA